MRAYGAPPEDIERVRLQITQTDEDYGLWEENEDFFHLYTGVRTQWNTTDVRRGDTIHKIRTGLRYEGVKADLEMTGLKRAAQREFWAEMKAVELAVLAAERKKYLE